MVYNNVSLPTFAREFEINRAARYSVKDNCSEMTFALAVDCSAFMNTPRTGGFCIHTPTKEIRFLHSIEGERGATLIEEAIQRGGTWLTCFDGYLKTLYEKHGFKLEKREKNWTVGKPDVLTMTL